MFCLAAPLAALIIWDDNGYLQSQAHSKELLNLQRENIRLREQKRFYLEQIQRLRTDPAAVVDAARKCCDLARPGDIVVKLPKPPSQTASPKP
jgi:cell division protein FtsB